ncbi:MAG: tetratricopeptide repeat protein [Chitinophagales bacterium]|nr:tetratricopeptide repeat protein [Chitinophagales bacterium]MDW8427723.1 tetratricopeptide repeat protein [Chitinophagales bacterium]
MPAQAKKKAAAAQGQAPTSYETARLTRFLPLFCGLLAALLYVNTLGHEFTVDDATVITKNKITTKGLAAIPEILTTPYRAGFHDRKESLYRPLPLMVFAALYEIAGSRPWLYHMTNVLIYGVTAGLAAYLMVLLFTAQPPWVLGVMSLWFAVHPIHTEVVANVKSLDELLAALMIVLALWASLRYLKQPAVMWLLLTATCFFLALMSKESAVAGLLLVPLTWYYFRVPSRRAYVLVALWMAGSLLLYLLLRYQALGALVNFEKIEPINNSLAAAGDRYDQRLATALYIIGLYIKLLFIPHPLSYDYSYNSIPLKDFGDPAVWLILLLSLGLAYVMLRGLQRKKAYTYGIWFFALTLAPVANIFLMIESTMAERFLFLPSLGFCMTIPLVLVRKNPSQHLSRGFAAILPPAWYRLFLPFFLVLSLKTIDRNRDWKDNYTLLQHDVQTNPNSARIRYALGSTIIFEKALPEADDQRRRQWLQEGIAHLQAGLEILNYYGEAWFNLGFAYNELDEYEKAIACFERARMHMQKLSAVHWVQMGLAYGESGRYKEAYAALHQALALNDTAFDAYNNMGLFFSRQGKQDSALHYLHRALQLRPINSKALYNMGNVFAALGDYPQAIAYYRKALHYEPQFVDALTNMGNCYAVQQQYDSALVIYHRALAIDPHHHNLRSNLSLTYRLKGDTAAARKFGLRP